MLLVSLRRSFDGVLDEGVSDLSAYDALRKDATDQLIQSYNQCHCTQHAGSLHSTLDI